MAKSDIVKERKKKCGFCLKERTFKLSGSWNITHRSCYYSLILLLSYFRSSIWLKSFEWGYFNIDIPVYSHAHKFQHTFQGPIHPFCSWKDGNIEKNELKIQFQVCSYKTGGHEFGTYADILGTRVTYMETKARQRFKVCVN